jgi:hypothetical protein
MTNTIPVLDSVVKNQDTLITTALMKDGSIREIEVDNLPEFWATEIENIKPQQFTPRRPRVSSK